MNVYTSAGGARIDGGDEDNVNDLPLFLLGHILRIGTD